jgi:hypothetical protein
MKRVFVVMGVIGLMLVSTEADAARRGKRGTTETTATFTDSEPELLLGLIPQGPDPADTFSGQVSSDRALCVPKRLVAIYKAGAANSIAHTTTASDGTWSVNEEDPAAGTYYAFVEPRVIRRHGKVLRCLSGRSGNMTV